MKFFGFENEFIAITFKQPLDPKSILNNETDKNEEFESLAENVKKSMSE